MSEGPARGVSQTSMFQSFCGVVPTDLLLRLFVHWYCYKDVTLTNQRAKQMIYSPYHVDCLENADTLAVVMCATSAHPCFLENSPN